MASFDSPIVIYAAVAKGSAVLHQHGTRAGNFEEVVGALLDNLERESSFSAESDRFWYHCKNRNGLNYVCVTDYDFARFNAFLLLDLMAGDLDARLLGASHTSSVLRSINFEEAIVSRMNEVNVRQYTVSAEPSSIRDAAEDAKIRAVREEVDQVKQAMMANVDAIVERGERMEVTLGRTEELANSSVRFNQSGRRLARKLWWQNVKLWVGVGLAFLIFLYIVVSVSCGGLAWQSCLKS